MNSKILEVYEALAATEITIAGELIKVAPLEQLPNSVTSLQTPIRILTPLQQFSPPNLASTSIGGAYQGSGGVLDLDWLIHDLLLWAPLASGKGLQTHASSLVTYCGEYIDLVRDAERLVWPANTWMQRWTLHVELIEFPLLSKMFYFGVRAILIVREKMMGA